MLCSLQLQLQFPLGDIRHTLLCRSLRACAMHDMKSLIIVIYWPSQMRPCTCTGIRNINFADALIASCLSSLRARRWWTCRNSTRRCSIGTFGHPHISLACFHSCETFSAACRHKLLQLCPGVPCFGAWSLRPAVRLAPCRCDQILIFSTHLTMQLIGIDDSALPSTHELFPRTGGLTRCLV